MNALVVTDSRIMNAETEYALAVARAEAAAGIQVAAAGPAESAFLEAAAEASLEVLEMPGREPSRRPGDFVAGARWISGRLKEGRVDILHTAGPAAHTAAGLAARGRAPLVHLRGSAAVPHRHPGNRYLYRRLTSAVVVSSERVRGWVVDRLGVPSGRVAKILAPVDAERFAPGEPDPAIRAELGIPDGAALVVNVARLAPIKGHEVLIRAMAGVLERVPEAVLLLVGEPWSGQPEGLRGLARSLGIDGRVCFAGRRDDVPRILAAADLCVSSSVGSEENSRAVGEYLSAGRPVVATAVGVIPELVDDGETGVLVPPGDAAALARAIASLLSDPAASRRLGSSARASALERLSWAAFEHRLIQLLDRVGVSL